MKEYLNHIYTELFDEPADLDLSKKGKITYNPVWTGTDDYVFAKIQLVDEIKGKNINLEVLVHKGDDGGFAKKLIELVKDIKRNEIYGFAFKEARGNYEDETKSGSASEIFGYLKKIFKKLLSQEKPKIIIFSGSKKSSSNLDRGRFYSLLLKRFSKEIENMGYVKKEKEGATDNLFIFIRKDIYNKHKIINNLIKQNIDDDEEDDPF